MKEGPIFVSQNGGTIDFFRGDSGWLYHVRSDHLSLYCDDLRTAKVQLDRLETLRSRSTRISLQVMKNGRRSLRRLVESAAAPYLEQRPA